MPAPKYKDIQILKGKLKDVDLISSHILDVLHSVGSKGAADDLVNLEVLKALEIEDQYIDFYLNQNYLTDALSDNCGTLKSKKLIGYNTKSSVWYLVKQSNIPLTPKERAYFKAKGFGAGWRRASDKLDVIAWIHEHLTPVEFEALCISILGEHCGVPIQMTEKRTKSGADGGFDGIGEYHIDGQTYPIAMQAKKYALNRQVGSDHCERFAGALLRRQWKHGFIITSGTFSEETKRSVEDYSKQGVLIELIDQNRLADIMLVRNESPHGFGIHLTDYGLYYMNEKILKNAAK